MSVSVWDRQKAEEIENLLILLLQKLDHRIVIKRRSFQTTKQYMITFWLPIDNTSSIGHYLEFAPDQCLLTGWPGEYSGRFPTSVIGFINEQIPQAQYFQKPIVGDDSFHNWQGINEEMLRRITNSIFTV